MDEFTGSKEVVRTLGDSITTLRRYDNAGRLTSQSVREYGYLGHQLLVPNDSVTYFYNPATSNLIRETCLLTPLRNENRLYSYDSLDRLIRRETRDYLDVVTSYCDVTYSNLGNISGKKGIGQYTYSSVKPHAVRSVENTDSLIPLTAQDVTYNAIGKVSRIVENGLRLDLYYDTEGQRCRSILRDTPTHIARTTRYYDNLDIITIDGVSTVMQYLDGGVIFIKEKNADQSTACLYHAVTDRLGSYTKILKGNGTAVFKANYDEWGRQTITTNTIGFLRGYTGHEMLPEFGLINMNGRMYDPLLARFLSPDDYVQMPMSPQGFNRYSYCMNNPMRYTDPSGELPWLVPMIAGAIIGAYTGASIHSHTAALWNWKSDAWKGAIPGAIIGASLGYSLGSAGASGGILNHARTAITKTAGTISSIINSGSVNIGWNLINTGSFSNSWKAGLVGMAVGAWSISGGFGIMQGSTGKGIVSGLSHKLLYQVLGTGLYSIGNNWTRDMNPLSHVNVGIGPINLTLGKNQHLFRLRHNLFNILTNGAGLVNTLLGGSITFDRENLSFKYQGGAIDYFFPPTVIKKGILEIHTSGFGAYSMIGNSNFDMVVQHEIHHLWHSRSMSDLYLFNYFIQGINSLILKGDFINKYNYYEDLPNSYPWW